MNDIILIPTDFSEVCNNAMNQAVEAAKFLNNKIALLHVIDKNTKAQLKKTVKEKTPLRKNSMKLLLPSILSTMLRLKPFPKRVTFLQPLQKLQKIWVQTSCIWEHMEKLECKN